MTIFIANLLLFYYPTSTSVLIIVSLINYSYFYGNFLVDHLIINRQPRGKCVCIYREKIKEERSKWVNWEVRKK